jgi:hypothetical protein
MADAEKTVLIPLHGQTATLQVETDSRSIKVTVDPDYDLPRHLSTVEQIPVIGRLEAERDLLLLTQQGQDDRFAPLLNLLKQRGVMVQARQPFLGFPRQRTRDSYRLRSGRGGDSPSGRRDGVGLSNTALAEHSVVVMGREHPVLNRLFGETAPNLPELPANSFVVAMLRHPLNPKQVLVVVDSTGRKETLLVSDRLENYGGYSSLVFVNGHLLSKNVSEGPRGIDLLLQQN